MTTRRRKPRLDLNPSSADRWTTCTASPRFILENWDKVPQDRDTVYSMEGTTAHAVAAAELTGQAFMEATLPSPVDAEMRWHAWNYAEYVNSFRKPGSTLLVESKIPLWYMPERNMMLDAGVRNPDSLHIFDFKYGEGVVVSPVENLQTSIYAYGFGAMGGPLPTDFPVFIHIYQPRGRAAEDGAQHVWETTWLEICKITSQIEVAAEYILRVGIPEALRFAPSEKACQWCPVKGFCEARRQSMTEGLEVIDEANTKHDCLPTPNVLTEHQLVKLLKHKADIVKWLNDVEEWAEEHLKAGGKIPGFKLVQSRGGNRFWSNPKEAEKALLETTVLKRSDIIEEKLLGPAGVEKLLGKTKFKGFAQYVGRPEGAPVIAPESNKREAVGNLLEDFEVLPEQNTETSKH